MKVLFVSRPDLHSNAGGDTTQVDRTRDRLRNLGYEVDLFEGLDTDSRGYDLVHFFNLIRPGDLPRGVLTSDVPLIVSPIFVDYRAAEAFHPEWKRRMLARVLAPNMVETFKAGARRMRGAPGPRNPDYFRIGHGRLMTRIAKRATLFLPNSASEGMRVRTEVGDEPPFAVVPNGYASDTFRVDGPKDARALGTILCVARIEPRKNQLELVRATKLLGRNLLLVGDVSPQNQGYLATCLREGGVRVNHLAFLPAPEVASLMRSADLHVLPSYFETTGLVSLEALACGCRIVVSATGDQPDYFAEVAQSYSPGDPSRLVDAIGRSLRNPPDAAAVEKLLKICTWTRAGDVTERAYRAALAGPEAVAAMARAHGSLEGGGEM